MLVEIGATWYEAGLAELALDVVLAGKAESRRAIAGRRWPPPNWPWPPGTWPYWPRRRAVLCASIFSQAFQRIRLAASSSMNASAIGNCTPWFWPMGRSNTTRSLAYFGRAVDEPVTIANALGGDQRALGVQAVQRCLEALAFLAHQGRPRGFQGCRRTARWSRG